MERRGLVVGPSLCSLRAAQAASLDLEDFVAALHADGVSTGRAPEGTDGDTAEGTAKGTVDGTADGTADGGGLPSLGPRRALAASARRLSDR